MFAFSISASPLLPWGEGACSFSWKNKESKEVTIEQFEDSNSSQKLFLKMKDSLIIRIVFIFLVLLLIVFTKSLQAGEIESSIQEIEPVEIFQSDKQLTQHEMNDLFGDDPYLGQTSYLQSPDGFTQREKLK